MADSLVWNAYLNTSAFNAGLAQMAAGMKGAQAAAGGLASALMTVGKITFVGLIAGITAVGAAITKTTQLAGQWGKDMARIAKVTDLEKGTQAYTQMSRDLLDIMAKMPAAQKDIMDVAATLGQLGIEQTGIPALTENILKMTSALEISGEAGATWIAKMANMNKEAVTQAGGIDQFAIKLGSAVNALENVSVAKATDITDAMTDAAGSFYAWSLSPAEQAAFITTAISRGIDPGLMRTMLSSAVGGEGLYGTGRSYGTEQVLNKKTGLYEEKKRTGLSGLDIAGEFLGVSAEEVNKRFTADSVNTIMDIVDAVKAKPGMSPGEQQAALQKIFGGYAAKEIIKLGGAQEEYARYQAIANEEMQTGTSINKEYEKSIDNLIDKGTIFKNAMKVLMIELGELFVPMGAGLFGGWAAGVQEAITWIRKMKDEGKGIKEIFTEAFDITIGDKIRDKLSSVKDTLSNVVQEWGAVLTVGFVAIKSGLVAQVASTFSSMAVSAAVGIAAMSRNVITGFARMAAASLGSLATMTVSTVASFSRMAISAAMPLATMTMAVLGHFGRMAAGALASVASMTASVIAGFSRMAAAAISSTAKMALTVAARFVAMAGMIAGPIAMITGAIVAVGLAITDFGGHGDELRGIAGRIKDAMMDIWSSIAENDWSGAFDKLKDYTMDAFDEIRDYIYNLDMTDAVNEIFDVLKSSFVAGGSKLLSEMEKIRDKLAEIDWSSVGQNIIDTITAAIRNGVSIISDVFDDIKQSIYDKDWSTTGAAVARALGDAIEFGLTTLYDIGAWIWNTIKSMLEEKAGPSWFEAISSAFWEFLVGFKQEMLGDTTWEDVIFHPVRTAVELATNFVNRHFPLLSNDIRLVAADIMATLSVWQPEFVSWFLSAFETVHIYAYNFVTEITALFKGLYQVITGTAADIQTTASTTAEAVKKSSTSGGGGGRSSSPYTGMTPDTYKGTGEDTRSETRKELDRKAAEAMNEGARLDAQIKYSWVGQDLGALPKILDATEINGGNIEEQIQLLGSIKEGQTVHTSDTTDTLIAAGNVFGFLTDPLGYYGMRIAGEALEEGKLNTDVVATGVKKGNEDLVGSTETLSDDMVATATEYGSKTVSKLGELIPAIGDLSDAYRANLPEKITVDVGGKQMETYAGYQPLFQPQTAETFSTKESALAYWQKQFGADPDLRARLAAEDAAIAQQKEQTDQLEDVAKNTGTLIGKMDGIFKLTQTNADAALNTGTLIGKMDGIFNKLTDATTTAAEKATGYFDPSTMGPDEFRAKVDSLPMFYESIAGSTESYIARVKELAAEGRASPTQIAYAAKLEADQAQTAQVAQDMLGVVNTKFTETPPVMKPTEDTAEVDASTQGIIADVNTATPILSVGADPTSAYLEVQSVLSWIWGSYAEITVGANYVGGNPSAVADGSHASGLSYVPFDNYLAVLHRGERVMTAAENQRYGSYARRGGSAAPSISYNPSYTISGSNAKEIEIVLKKHDADIKTWISRQYVKWSKGN